MNAHVTVRGPLGRLPPNGKTAPGPTDAFLRTILHSLPLGVCWQRYGRGAGCWISEPFARLAGQPAATFTSVDSFDASLAPEDRAAYAASLVQLRTKLADRLSLELRCRNGEQTNWCELTLQAYRTPDGTLRDLVLTLADIGERKQHQEEMQRAVESADSLNQQIEIALDRAQRSAVEANIASEAIQQLAVLDELTRLYNRRGFHTLYPDVIHQVKNTDGRGYLCYFDLDRFKQINDELGHAKGDEALVEFSSTLRGTFPKGTLLVRLGGDEFVAMGAERLAGQIDETLRNLQAALAARNATASSGFNLESSVGVTYFDKTGPQTIDELTTAADAELYKNKESRRHARASLPTALPSKDRS